MTERERALLMGKKVNPLTANESAIAYAVAHGGGSEPTYETVAEIPVGTMVENHGLYIFQPSDSIPLARNETLFFNSEEYPLEYAEEGTIYYYNFDVSTGAATGTPSYAVSIDGSFINGLISDTPDLSNTTVRILKKVEQGGDIPENVKPTYEFGFTATLGPSGIIATADSGVTYAAIADACAETPHVFAIVKFGAEEFRAIANDIHPSTGEENSFILFNTLFYGSITGGDAVFNLCRLMINNHDNVDFTVVPAGS